MKLTLANAQRDHGRVTLTNGKMPGPTWSTTTDQCNVGSKLAKIPGSVCHGCYAARLEAYRKSAHKGWTDNHLKASTMIAANAEAWSQAMAFQITKLADKSEPYHRWFGAGDIKDLAMLRAICRVCELTPTIKHWLPTREAAVVKALLRERDLPANLVIRISATMIDDAPIKGHAHTSTVHRHKPHVGSDCHARDRDNQCGPCRDCWDPTIENVSYPYH